MQNSPIFIASDLAASSFRTDDIPPKMAMTSEKQRNLPLCRAWRRVGGRIFDVAWSPASEQLCTAGEDHGLIWSPSDDGNEPCPTVKLVPDGGGSSGNQGGGCMRCAWHPSGKYILTGSAAGVVTVHSAADGSSVGSVRAAANGEHEVYGLTVLSNEGLLGVGVGDTVQQWDLLHARQTALTEFDAHESGVAFGGTRNPEGRAYVFSVAARGRVLSASLSDGTCRLLDAQSLAPLHVLDEHARRGASCFACALSPSSTQLATAASDGVILLYDLRQLKRGSLGELGGHTSAVHGLAFAPAGSLGSSVDDGELLTTGSNDGMVRIAGTRSCKSVCSLHVGGPVLCTAVDHARDRIASGGGSGACATDNVLSLWSALPSGAATSPQPKSPQPKCGSCDDEHHEPDQPATEDSRMDEDA